MPMRSVEAIEVSLRAFLVALTTLCVWQAMVAPGLLLQGHWRAVPWLVMATAAMAWSLWMMNVTAVKLLTILIVLGFSLRAAEVVVYSPAPFPNRMANAAFLIFAAGVALIFAFQNITIVVTRQARAVRHG